VNSYDPSVGVETFMTLVGIVLTTTTLTRVIRTVMRIFGLSL
jgi:hypothetical protein